MDAPVPAVVVVGAGPGGLAVAGALALRGIRATVVDRAPEVGSSWRGHYDRLRLHTPRGLSHLPGLRIPRSAGRWVARDDVVRYLEAYAAHIVHAAAYRTGAPYAGREVLVVGAGNTGAEIATDLADHGARVHLSVRTPPHIVRRSTLGWPAQATGILVRRLPVPVVDTLARVTAPLQSPDLSAWGLSRPTSGLSTQVRRGRIPVQDVGVVDAIRTGRVVPVAGVVGVDRADVVLSDGQRLRPEVLVVATGYSHGLQPLVGHLQVLDARGLPIVHGARTTPSAPGLHFIGFSNPISGMFRELRIDAGRIARSISRQA